MTALHPARTTTTTLLGATAGGLAAGALTSVLQGVLPGSWGVLADSGAMWSVVAFALASSCVQVRWTAVLGGLLALCAEVAGYYAIALPLRGIASSPAERVLWTCAAIAVGPALGAAAFYRRRGVARERALAVAGVCGIVAGEGLHNLLRDAAGHRVGWVELVGATTACACDLVAARPGRDARGAGVVLGALVAGAAVAAAVYLVYAEPLLL